MATLYWVGGAGTWDGVTTTHWSTSSGGAGGAAVPTIADDVIFNASSGGGAIVFGTGAVVKCASLTTTGFTGTMSFNSITATTVEIAGSFVLGSHSFSYGSTSGQFILFTGTGTGYVIDTQSSSGNKPGLRFTTAGSWTFNSNYVGNSSGNPATLILTAGSVNTNGKTMTNVAFQTSGTTTRSLTLGATSWAVGGGGWDVQSTTGFTFSGASSTISGLGGSGGTIALGGLTYGTVNFNSSSFIGQGFTLSGTNTFANLTFVPGTYFTGSVAVKLAANQIVTGTLTLTSTNGQRALLASDSLGTQRTVTVNGSVVASYFDFRDINAAGSASWNLSSATGGSGNAGNNSNITFTTGANQYWVGGTGNWSNTARWASTSGGTASSGRMPLPQDTAIFNSSSFTAGSQVVTMDRPRWPNVDFTGVTNNPRLTYGGSSINVCEMYGNVTFTSAMTINTSPAWLGWGWYGGGSGTLNMGGNTFAFNAIAVSGVGSFTLGSNITTGTFTITLGTFNLGSNTLTCTTGFTTSTALSKTLNLNSGTIILSGTGTVFNNAGTQTINAGTSTIQVTNTSATLKTLTFAGITLNNLTISGDNIVMSGSNTFTGTLALNNAGLTTGFKLTSGTTTTLTGTSNVFTNNGSSGALTILASSTSGSAATLTAPNVTKVSLNYMSIKDSTVTQTGVWFAGPNSTSVSNNTRWTFSAPAYTITATKATFTLTRFDAIVRASVIVAAQGSFVLAGKAAGLVYQMNTPIFRSAGAFAEGTAALSVGLPAGFQADDLLIMFVESANQAITTPSGWTQVPNSPQGTGTAAGTSATLLAAFYKIATGSETAVSVADAGNHTDAIILAFRNVNTFNPINASAGSVQASNSTAVSWPAVTTTTDKCFILNAVGSMVDIGTARLSVSSNAALTGFGELTDNSSTQGNGGGIATTGGTLVAAGSSGTTAGTLATTSLQGKITIAIAPYSTAVDITATGTAAGTSDASAAGQTLNPITGSAAGTSDASATSQSLNPMVAIASGSSTMSAVGASLNAAVGTAAGTSDMNAQTTNVGTAEGSSTVVGVGRALIPVAVSAAGTSTVTGVIMSEFRAVGTATGTSNMNAGQIAAEYTAGSAAGVGAASATSATNSAATGVATGVAAALGAGSSQNRSTASAVGVAAALGAGSSQNAAVGSSSGTSDAIAHIAGLGFVVGSTSGVSAAAATGNSRAAAVGSSLGVSTVDAGSASLRAAAGSATGVGQALAAGSSQNHSTANAAGTSDAVANGTAGITRAVTASGVAVASGVLIALTPRAVTAVGTSTVQAVGVTGGVRTVTASGTSIAAAVGISIAESIGQSIGLGLASGRIRFNHNLPVPFTNFKLKSGASRFGYSVIKFTGEPVPLEHIADAQELEGDAYTDLFQIILSDKASKLYLKMNRDVTWQGNKYEGTGIKIDGVATYASDEVSRPNLTLFNPEGVYSSLVDDGLLDGAKVIRYRVLNTDIENDRPLYRVQQWKVSRIANLRVGSIVLELRDLMDGQTFMVPYRMFIPPDFPTVSIS